MYLPSTYELSLIHKIYSSLYVNIEKQLHDMQISVYKREVHFNQLLLKYEVPTYYLLDSFFVTTIAMIMSSKNNRLDFFYLLFIWTHTQLSK